MTRRMTLVQVRAACFYAKPGPTWSEVQALCDEWEPDGPLTLTADCIVENTWQPDSGAPEYQPGMAVTDDARKAWGWDDGPPPGAVFVPDLSGSMLFAPEAVDREQPEPEPQPDPVRSVSSLALIGRVAWVDLPEEKRREMIETNIALGHAARRGFP